jgi:hypothetical protein
MPNFTNFNKIFEEIMRNSGKYKENFMSNFHSADCELRKPYGEKCTCGFVKRPTKEDVLREALEKCVDWLEKTNYESTGPEYWDWDEFDVVVEKAKKALEK